MLMSISFLASTASANYILLPAEITELLPNPKLPQTDEHDEFIELYNPGIRPFDLTGYTLQVGTTTKHSYVFPRGTQLKPNSYSAFYSSKTHLLLNDYSDQATLFNLQNKIISQSPIYRNPKPQESWSKGIKTWYWSTKPTPGAPNTNNQLLWNPGDYSKLAAGTDWDSW